jgi:cytochrome c peroxidase
VGGRIGARNPPTVLNAMFSTSLFWDGRASSLEEQVKHPLVNPDEMGMPSHGSVIARVGAVPEYRRRFRRVFGGEGITIDTIAKAIAAYERTRLSGNAPFDRFIAGERGALTEAQGRGWELFRHKARCITCHTFDASVPFFTDNRFHNTGAGSAGVDYVPLVERTRRGGDLVQTTHMNIGWMAHTAGLSGLGRYLVTGSLKDVGAFKTPTLRDVELTTPYMHDGSEKTLLDVVKFYNRGGRPNPYLDGGMRPLHLTEGEMNDLVEFMRALTSDDVLRQAQNTSPQTREPALVPSAQARDSK